MANDPASAIKVLAVDGGGIRGIIPAVILGELQKRLTRKLWQTFDLIAGTSTGGIIALGLGTACNNGKPYSPDQLLNLYLQNGSAIFKKSWLTSLRQLLFPKYSPDGIAGHPDKIFPRHGILHRPDSTSHLQLQSPETAPLLL
jgi:patatin-like phospholipase/acyl hydrolase